jgi:hypothetical protein
MPVGANISVITAGAVLAFATRFHTDGFSVHAVGGVLMLVGLVSLILQIASIYRQRQLTTAQAELPQESVMVRPAGAYGDGAGSIGSNNPYAGTTAAPLRPGEELTSDRFYGNE